MSKVFIPSVKKEGEEVSGQSDRDILFDLIARSSYQQRLTMRRHPLLDLAAQNKADNMAINDYFGHTSPIGLTANGNIRRAGYPLPDHYPTLGNNVESLSIGGDRPEEVVAGWYGSPKHKGHVFGENSFYREQECIGIGLAVAKDGRTLSVFISCPCPL